MIPFRRLSYIFRLIRAVSSIYRKVHISKVTLKSLNGAFKVTVANGSARSKLLYDNNIETYFIVAPASPAIPRVSSADGVS